MNPYGSGGASTQTANTITAAIMTIAIAHMRQSRKSRSIGYLPSVASRTILAADWLASSDGCWTSKPTTGALGCAFRQWTAKLAFTRSRALTLGFRTKRSSETTVSQSEHVHTNGTLVPEMNAAAINIGMDTVSHSRKPIARPVDFKRHQYPDFPSLDRIGH